MTIKQIKTKRDYQNALTRLDIIFDAKPNSSEGAELEELATLIERYEQEHYSINGEV